MIQQSAERNEFFAYTELFHHDNNAHSWIYNEFYQHHVSHLWSGNLKINRKIFFRISFYRANLGWWVWMESMPIGSMWKERENKK